MLWITLFSKIGKLPIKQTQHSHVYAVIQDSRSNKYNKVYLCLKYDAFGRPYFVEETKKQR